MARKNSYNYFDTFIKLADYSCRAASIVDEVLHNFNENDLPAVLVKAHEIEHAADEQKHEMMEALAREFLPPIEVEDIAEIAQLLDEVTDSVEDVLIKLYAFNIKSIRPAAVAFSEIIVKCCGMLKETITQFGNFKKSTTLTKSIIEINRLESEGDELYTQAMRDLHVNSNDPIEILTWSRMFDYLERCCDTMEDVADSVENIVMKNS